jgi:hypothetical protein
MRVIPAELAEGLVAGLEAVEEVGDHQAVLTAREALDHYRQAMEEGK